MRKKKVKKKAAKKGDKKLQAFITTFLSLLGFVIALVAWRKDKYVMFYAAQSIVVFVIAIIASVIQNILLFIPILGWIINAALGILVFILWLISWLNALSGEMKEVPMFGKWGRKINL